MTGFKLPSNFNPNPHRIGRVVRPRILPPQISLSTNPVYESASNSESDSSSSSVSKPPSPMAATKKTLREFSAPSSSNFPGLDENPVEGGFELRSSLVNMVQASPFCGKASEDARAHLMHYLEVCSTINPNGTPINDIRLRLFPFSLLGKPRSGSTLTRQASTITGRHAQMHF